MAALNNDQPQQKFPDPPNFEYSLTIIVCWGVKMMCRYYTHFPRYKTERPTSYMGIEDTLSHNATTTTYLDIVENHTFVNKKNIESKVSQMLLHTALKMQPFTNQYCHTSVITMLT